MSEANKRIAAAVEAARRGSISAVIDAACRGIDLEAAVVRAVKLRALQIAREQIAPTEADVIHIGATFEVPARNAARVRDILARARSPWRAFSW